MHNASITVNREMHRLPVRNERMTYDDVQQARAARLRQARLAAGFRSAGSAARRFHWPEPTYRQHESGVRGLVKVAGEYAKAFKVSEAWLLQGVGAGPGKEDALEKERLLAIFENLDQEQKAVVLSVAASLQKSSG